METADDTLTQARAKLWNYCRSQMIPLGPIGEKNAALSWFSSRRAIDDLLSINDQGKVVMDMLEVASLSIQYSNTRRHPTIRRQLMARLLGYGFQESFLDDPAAIRLFAQEHGILTPSPNRFPGTLSMAFSVGKDSPALQFHRPIPPLQTPTAIAAPAAPPASIPAVNPATRMVPITHFRPLPPFVPTMPPASTRFREAINPHLRVQPSTDITRLFQNNQPVLVELTRFLGGKGVTTVGALAGMSDTELLKLSPGLFTPDMAAVFIRHAGVACGEASGSATEKPFDAALFTQQVTPRLTAALQKRHHRYRTGDDGPDDKGLTR